MALAEPHPDDNVPAAWLSLMLELRRPAWQARAACRGVGPADWFPTRGTGEGARLRRARDVCAGCPVRGPCAEFGDRERHGVWGGRTERQRQRARRGQRGAPEAAPGGAPVAAARQAAPPAPANREAPPSRRRWAMVGAAAAVPMDPVYDPDTRTVEQWRASPAGRGPAGGLGEALAAIEAQLTRPRRGMPPAAP